MQEIFIYLEVKTIYILSNFTLILPKIQILLYMDWTKIFGNKQLIIIPSFTKHKFLEIVNGKELISLKQHQVIITINPPINPSVATSVYLSCWVSDHLPQRQKSSLLPKEA